jgi:hypothetical protein
MAGGDRKKLRSRGGFEAGSALSHMNRQNMNTPVKNQIQTKTIERQNPCKLNNQ